MQTQTLTATRRRSVLIVGGSLIFVILGAARASQGASVGWPVVVLFGLAAVVFTADLIRPATLALTPEGFTLTTAVVGRTATRRWSDCGEFRVSRAGLGPRLISYPTPLDEKTVLRRSVAGANEAIKANFGGLSADAFADLLNRYRLD